MNCLRVCIVLFAFAVIAARAEETNTPAPATATSDAATTSVISNVAPSTITILSLVVAILAVFVGPLIAWFIAKRQINSALAVANKQVTAPLRQAWINDLRSLLAQLTSRALHYYVAGYEDRSDKEYQELTLLEHKIALMLNPGEEDHKRLETAIRKLVAHIQDQGRSDSVFPNTHKEVMKLSREILKREWNRVKEPLLPT